jgi:putative ABC transport system permease protein
MNQALLVAKNLSRRKLRTTLLLVAIFIAFFLYGCLTSFKQAFYSGESVGTDRMITINKINFTVPLPFFYVDRVRQIDGVTKVSHASWFGGYYQDPREVLISFAVEPDTYLALYSDITMPAEQRRSFLANRIGLAAGRSVAEKYGWRVGSRIPISSNIYSKADGSHTWEFTVEAIFSSPKESGNEGMVLLHYDYFNDTVTFGRDQVGQIVFKAKSAAHRDRAQKTIDTAFANSTAETTTDTEAAFNKAFAAQFGNIALIISLVVAAAFAAILLIVGNTMVMAIRERTRDIGVLKTLGFSGPTILAQILAESLLLALVGGLLGLGAAALALHLSADALRGFIGELRLTSSVLLAGIGWMLLLGLVTGAVPAIAGMRLNIVTALGRK